KNRENQQGDGRESARNGGDLLERAGFGLDLLREDRIGERGRCLQQQVRSRREPCRHGRVVCKGRASYILHSCNGTKSATPNILAQPHHFSAPPWRTRVPEPSAKS